MMEKKVHIYGASFSNFVRTVMLMCEEKHITYSTGFEINGIMVPFKSEQHYALHPFGKFPVLLEGDLVLAETSSICRYLDADKTLQPKNHLDSSKHDALCAHISIDIDKALIRDYLIEFAFPKGDNGEVRFDIVKKTMPAAIHALKYIEGQLANTNLLGGTTLSIADTLLAPMLAYLSSLPQGYNLLTDMPKVDAYLKKLMSHKSCQKVLLANPKKSLT
jgi:glutathione S-transferase